MVIEFNIPVDLELLAKKNPEIKMGGRFSPKDCVSPHKVAIIIPFRNRQEHLKYWLYYLHPILQRQQLDYGIYVINQVRLWKMGRGRWNSGTQTPAQLVLKEGSDFIDNLAFYSEMPILPLLLPVIKHAVS